MKQVERLKIPVGIARHLVKQRTKNGFRQKYETNAVIRAWDTYICLKHLTGTGKIKNFHGQIDQLAFHCKVSRTTFYSRLEKCQELGLLSIKNHHINLVSWEATMEEYGILWPDFYTIKYDLSNKKQTVQYFIRALEIWENMDLQKRNFEVRCKKNPQLYQDIRAALHEHGFPITSESTVDQVRSMLAELQVQSFKNMRGTKYYDTIHELRADVNRNAAKIRKAHNMKSRLSASYMKRKLEKIDLAAIVRVRSESKARSRLYLKKTHVPAEKAHYVEYDKLRKTTIWWQPDRIIFDSWLLGKNLRPAAVS